MLKTSQPTERREFIFGRDTFAFENETFWIYHFENGKKTSTTKRDPPPTYGHRCFVLTRAARKFFFHTRFDPAQIAPDDTTCRTLIRKVMARNPLPPREAGKEIVIPGYANLYEFSKAREPLLKSNCGGAWRSYVMRSHWRMIFPISREHQRDTAAALESSLKKGIPPGIHVVKFPALSINHSILLFGVAKTERGLEFQAYDPNDPLQPTKLSFDSASNTFSLPGNHYWRGGELDVIEIYRTWWM